MTVQIILMNKSGIVAASDRTLIDRLDGKQLHHKQQKLFPLTQPYKATLMFNHNNQINGVPWDIVIHQYQQHLEKQQPNLIDTNQILAHFLAFLQNQKTLFPADEQQRYAAYDLLSYFKNYREQHYRTWQEKEVCIPFADYLSQSLYSFFLDKEYQIQQTEQTYPQYQEIIQTIHNQQLSNILDIPHIAPPLRRAIDHIMQYLLFHENIIHEYTEIVIAGYGSEMIFPSVSAAHIGGCYCGNLHYKMQNTQKISHNNQAQIIPFAQSQYINESLKGLSHENEDFILNLFYDVLSNISTVNIIDKTSYFEEFRLKLSQHLRDQHISPMIQAIKHMQEDDLAGIACAFLQISQFKRNLAALSFNTPTMIDYVTINHQQGITSKQQEAPQHENTDTYTPSPQQEQ